MKMLTVPRPAAPGMTHCLTTTVREEGIIGPWRPGPTPRLPAVCLRAVKHDNPTALGPLYPHCISLWFHGIFVWCHAASPCVRVHLLLFHCGFSAFHCGFSAFPCGSSDHWA